MELKEFIKQSITQISELTASMHYMQSTQTKILNSLKAHPSKFIRFQDRDINIDSGTLKRYLETTESIKDLSLANKLDFSKIITV